ncbi:hypothetical protein MMC31_004117 [Peltigera leucophlebia]|nr:hypothetical protein [Peltigera leucophlebia]
MIGRCAGKEDKGLNLITDMRKRPRSRGDNHGPPFLRDLSKRLSKRLTAWQTMVLTLLWLYISRNFAKIVGLESPEPLANLYNRAYFRATWVTTALDAGFWTAMKIRRKWLRDLASMVFSIYYLFAAEQADEKVRKVRGLLTVEHLRVSWHKSTTPYLSFITRVLRPKLTQYPPRAIRIPRPAESSYKDPVNAWLYFDGPLSALSQHTKLVLDYPGGGYVAMSPRHHEDKLLAWAGKLGIPVLSIDYRKAPEYPYPYALNECYDVYHTIVATMGRCVGLSGASPPRIVLTGDSAGGNFATGVILMILQSASNSVQSWQGQQPLPVPDGLILIYPSLDMNIGNWMSDDQMSLIQDRHVRKRNRNILRRKSEDYYKLTPETPLPSDDEEETKFPFPRTESPIRTEPRSLSPSKSVIPAQQNQPPASEIAHQTASITSSKPKHLKTRLAMSSMISYFNDRILTPEMMRAMIILYVGPHIRPDFSTDFLLSPVLAPEALLAQFPKTYFLTGERDPLVDDTVIFAGRLRQSKYNQFIQRKELGLLKSKEEFNEKDHVQVTLIPGISHGFLQFVSVFPEGLAHIFRCGRWIEDIFFETGVGAASASSFSLSSSRTLRNNSNSSSTFSRNLKNRSHNNHKPHHHRTHTTESSGDEDRPLEMSSSSNHNHNRDGGSGSISIANNANSSSSVIDSPRRNSQEESSRRKISRGKLLSLGREKSLVRLASEDDLLGRRMKGLAGGLMGMDEDGVKTP